MIYIRDDADVVYAMPASRAARLICYALPLLTPCCCCYADILITPKRLRRRGDAMPHNIRCLMLRARDGLLARRGMLR